VRAETRRLLRDYGGAILAAVTIAILIRTFVLEAYRIPTAAMRPALEPGDTLFVAKRPVGFRGNPSRGDIVVFSSPYDQGRDYIKRVLAVEGDTVQVRKGKVTLNGKPEESHPYLIESPIIEDFGPEKVPAGSVFVLGDMRSIGPFESRKRKGWGIIPVAAIKGKAAWIWLSVEPQTIGAPRTLLPKFRFERMFRRVE
jgi:signal peptidase I